MRGKHVKRALRHGHWKWIKIGLLKDELYNITDDIGETRNLINNWPDVARRFRKLHADWESKLPAINRTSMTCEEHQRSCYRIITTKMTLNSTTVTTKSSLRNYTDPHSYCHCYP